MHLLRLHSRREKRSQGKESNHRRHRISENSVYSVVCFNHTKADGLVKKVKDQTQNEDVLEESLELIHDLESGSGK